MTYRSGVYANETVSAIKQSVRPAHMQQSAHDVGECPAPQCTVAGEPDSQEASSTEASEPHVRVAMGEPRQGSTCARCGKVDHSNDDENAIQRVVGEA